MGTSKVDVCNLALSLIGEREIRSEDEDNIRARMSSNFFDSSRDYVLALFDWPFARGFKLMRELVVGDDEIPHGHYLYQKPTDCLVPKDIYPKGSSVPWEVMGGTILTVKATPVYLYYTKTVDNPTLFSAPFINCLSIHIAARLAHPLSEDKQLAGRLAAQFSQAMTEATAVEAIMGSEYRHADEDPNNDSFVTGADFNFFDEEYRP